MRLPSVERFMAKVHPEPMSGCWLWTGATKPTGYGNASFFAGETMQAHRMAYEIFVGPIPRGLVLDHKCRTRCCVNPDHLEPVTPSENVARGNTPSVNRARFAAQTHCKRGHALEGRNVILNSAPSRRGRTARICRTCLVDGKRQRRAAAREVSP